MNASQVDNLLTAHSITSDQVTRQDLLVVLGQLERVIEQRVPGDIVEFGCYTGTTSLFIRRLLDAYEDGRGFHVYDSFVGLPEKTPRDQSAAGSNFRAGQLAASKKQFIREFQHARLRLPVIHKGWFSDLTPADVPAQIAFAFLDGDFYESIKSSLKLVLPRMHKGGTIVVHDYAREALPGVARAIQEAGLQATTDHGLGIIKL